MKDFITEFGRGLIDLIAIIVLFGIIIFAMSTLINNGFWACITILLVGLIAFVLSFYLLYLLIDIKDNTRDISNLLKNHFGIDAKDVILSADITQQLIEELYSKKVNLGKIENYILNKANINVANDKGRTPIMIAAIRSEPSMIKLIEILIENGANVNVKDNEGNSVLFYAKASDNPKKDEIIKLLERHGAK